MSKYTTEVRFICEQAAGLDESVGYDDLDEVLTETTVGKVFDFDFPIFDENYRYALCKKILEHYYTREIGYETVGLWKQKLRARMREIMPYYNKLYKSELIEFNPLYDVQLTVNKDGNVAKSDRHGKDNTKTGNGSVDRNYNELDNETVGSDETLQGNETRNKGELENTKRAKDESNKSEIERNDNESELGSRIAAGSSSETGKSEKNANGSSLSDNEVSGEVDNNSSMENNTVGSNRSEKNKKQVYSDTPQGGLTGLMNGNYMTNATVDDGGDNALTTGSSDGTSQGHEARNTKEKSADLTSESSEQNDERSGSQNTDERLSRVGTKIGSESGEVTIDGNEEENRNKVENENVENDVTKNRNDNKNGNKIGTESVENNTEEAGHESGFYLANSVEDYLENVIGKRGSMTYSKMLMEYRETFLNIDLMVIRELNSLFMMLW